MGKQPAPPWAWMVSGALLLAAGAAWAFNAPPLAPDLASLQRMDGVVTTVQQGPSHRTRTAKNAVMISGGTWDMTFVSGDEVRYFDLGHFSDDQISRTHALTRERDVVALHDGTNVWQLETPSGIAVSYPARKANAEAERKTHLGLAAVMGLFGLVSVGVGSMQSRQRRTSGHA
jgi:hypothetical protein